MAKRGPALPSVELWLRAARDGEAGALRRAIAAGFDVNAQDAEGWSAAMFAAFNGWDECLELLLKAGADIEAQTDRGWTAAMWAARWNQDECLRMLIDAGCDLAAKNHAGAGLREVAQGDCVETVRSELARCAALAEAAQLGAELPETPAPPAKPRAL